MEVYTVLVLTKYSYQKRGFFVESVVNEDDSTMK